MEAGPLEINFTQSWLKSSLLLSPGRQPRCPLVLLGTYHIPQPTETQWYLGENRRSFKAPVSPSLGGYILILVTPLVKTWAPGVSRDGFCSCYKSLFLVI